MVVAKKSFYKNIIRYTLILSFFIGHLSAMQEVPIEEYEDQVKSESPQSRLPHELSFFQKRVVEVPPSNSKQLSLSFGQPEGMFVVDYNLNSKTIGRLIQTNGGISFESHDPQKYDFLLQSPVKTGKLSVDILGRFVFRKSIDSETASVSSKSVEFLEKFSSAKTISLDVDYGDNRGDIACVDFSFKGNRFNCKPKSKLTAQGSLAILAKQRLSNDGQILCTDKALISTSFFENGGILKAGNLVFDNGNIFNEGSILVDGSFMGLCKDFDHQGKVKVGADCIFEKVNNLTSSPSSSWHVGNDWKATVATLDLSGDTQVGNLALFKVASRARLGGPLRASIIYVDSDDLITCDSPARLFATHHIGLNAQGWMEYQGDVYKTFVHEAKNSQELDKENSLFKIFPRGVFLRSVQSGIKKSGNIVSKSGTVALDAKKGLIHTGLTDAGFAENAMILMNAASITLEKESILKSLNAKLKAQNSIEQRGSAQIKEKLVMQAPEIVHSGSPQVGDLTAQADTIKMTAESQIKSTGNASFIAKDSIENAGGIAAEKQLAMQAQNISMEATSRVEAQNASFTAKESIKIAGALTAEKQLAVQAQNISLEGLSRVEAQNASIQADESINNQSELCISESLYARAKIIKNARKIAAKNAHFKADRLWWNQWGAEVNIEEGFTIDALLSMNTFALLEAQDLTINSAVDLNLFGEYYAKKMNLNALIGINAGLIVPRCDSVDDVLTVDNGLIVGDQLLRFVPGGQYVRMGIGICKGAYGLYHQIPELIEDIKKVNKLDNAGVSDWIPLLCRSKKVAMAGYQTGRMTYDAGHMAYDKWGPSQAASTDASTPEIAQTKQPSAPKPEKQTENSINWQDIADEAPSIALNAASSIASTLGPQMSRDMLIDINLGAMLGVNGSSQSVLNANYGISAFANTYNMNTCYGTNRGLLAGAHVSVQALAFTNTRTMAANKLFVQADTFRGSEGSTIHAAQTHIKASALDNKGSTRGKLAVKCTGNADQVKSLGNVEDMEYEGPVDNGLADTLVEGNSNLLKVSDTGSVGIHAGNQNVDLKDAHDTKHSIQVTSNENITVHKSLKSGGSIGLDAGKNINHKSLGAVGSVEMNAGGSIAAQSVVERTVDGPNYEDKVDRVTVTAGNAITVAAVKNIEHEGVDFQSGKGGTHLTAGGNFTSQAQVIENYREYTKKDKEGNVTESEKVTHKEAIVSKYKSEGDTKIQAGDTVELYGTTFDNTNGVPSIHGKNGVNGQAVYDTHEHESDHKKDGGWFGTSKTSHEETFSETAKDVDFKGKSDPQISSDQKISGEFTSETGKMICNARELEIKTAQSTTVSASHSKGENLVWKWENHSKKEETTYSPSLNEVETNADRGHVQDVAGRAAVKIDARNSDMQLTRELFKELHNHQKVSTQGPTRAATMVIALAVTMATAGTGSALGAGIATGMGIKSAIVTSVITNMTSAAVTSFATQATQELLNCNGDLHAAATKIASLDTFKKVVLSTATAGAITGANCAIDLVVPVVSEGTNIGQKLAYAAPRQAAGAGIRTMADVAAGHDLKDAAIGNIRSAVANTVEAAGASEIGGAYDAGKINPLTHKALHAGAGALSGAIAGGKSGAAAGALGAVVAETVADAFSPKKPSLERMMALEQDLGRPLTQEEFVQQWNNQTRDYMQRVATHADISKLAAASVALLARQDIGIAHTAGATAVDNNFLGLVALGVVAGSAAYSAYNVYGAYQEGGSGAALQQLGIEVVTEAAGLATGAVAGKVIGKVGYKFGTKIYPIVEAAMEAAFEAQPGLKIALGKFSNTVIAGAERIGNSAVGKGLQKADQWAAKQTAKVTDGLAHRLTGLGEDIGAAHVPGSVAAKMEARTGAQVAQAEAQAAAKPLRPLGLGSTGIRIKPESLHEQIVLEGVIADPYIGKAIDLNKGMTDRRWHQDDGWIKMGYRNHKHGIDIHYVAQFKDDIIIAIDDFKFINKPRPMFFDYKGKK